MGVACVNQFMRKEKELAVEKNCSNKKNCDKKINYVESTEEMKKCWKVGEGILLGIFVMSIGC